MDGIVSNKLEKKKRIKRRLKVVDGSWSTKRETETQSVWWDLGNFVYLGTHNTYFCIGTTRLT